MFFLYLPSTIFSSCVRRFDVWKFNAHLPKKGYRLIFHSRFVNRGNCFYPVCGGEFSPALASQTLGIAFGFLSALVRRKCSIFENSRLEIRSDLISFSTPFCSLLPTSLRSRFFLSFYSFVFFSFLNSSCFFALLYFHPSVSLIVKSGSPFPLLPHSIIPLFPLFLLFSSTSSTSASAISTAPYDVTHQSVILS